MMTTESWSPSGSDASSVCSEEEDLFETPDSGSAAMDADREQDLRRKRRRLILVSTLTYIQCVAAFALSGTPGHITASFRRQRADFIKLVLGMKSSLFQRCFRMKIATFQLLYSKLADDLHRDPVQAVRSCGAPIYPVLRLAMALRWLAGGSYLDICPLYGVSPEGFRQSLWLTLAAIVIKFPITFSMQRPTLLRTAADFLKRQRKAIFRGVAGCLDGILIKCKRPTAVEYPKPLQFWCRKGYFGLNVQAICDARRIFTMVSIDCPASVHDSVAFAMSTLGKFLHRLPPGFYLLADAAYKAFPRILVPYEGRGSIDAERVFSFYHSSLRMNIECAFGLLVARWGVLWRPLQNTLAHNVLVIQACFAMHNFCEMHKEPLDLRPPQGRRSVQLDRRPHIDGATGSPEDMLAGSDAEHYARTNPNMAQIRRELTNEMAALGMARPLSRFAQS